ncbi:MAG: hypothetical protein V1799_10745 [bacterium]
MKRYLLVTFVILGLMAASLSAATRDGESERSKSFAVTKGGKLIVKVYGGELKITSWEKNEVFAKVTKLDEKDSEQLVMEQDGNTVRIELKNKSSRSRRQSPEFAISIPSQFDAQLSTGGGGISVQGKIKGSVTGTTGGGSITLEDAVEGELNLTTGGGEIRAKNVAGNTTLTTGGGEISIGSIEGKVTVTTGGGSVTLDKVLGELTVTTGGGNIVVESVTKSLKATTGGGEIYIKNAGGDIKASSGGGEMKIGKVTGNATMSTGGGAISLDGATGKVSLTTGGGELDIRNVTGSVKATTGGGDIVAELRPTGQGGSKLTSGGGDITLYVPEDARVTIIAVIKVEDKDDFKKYKIMSEFKHDKYESNDRDEEIRAVYTLNGGGEEITLTTSESDITIKKLKK